MMKKLAAAWLVVLASSVAWADARKQCADWRSTSADRQIEVCTKIIRSDSEAVKAYINRGHTYDATGDAARADGNVAGNSGDLDRALAYYDKAIGTNPKSAASYNGRGSTYEKKGDLDRALADYDKAIEIDPKYAWAYNNRGSAYEKRGDLDRALADYTKAIEIDAKFAYAYNNRGAAFERKGELDRALADHTKAIEINPRYAWAYNNRGNVQQAKGDLDRALADYSKAIEIDAKYARAWGNRGVIYGIKGDYQRALADYAKAVELEPKNAGALRTLAVARYDSGDFAGAAQDLLRFTELKDDAYVFAYRYLARARLGEKPQAELETNAARLPDKSWPAAVLDLLLGKKSAAATLEAASKPEEMCEAQFYVGQWHLVSGKPVDAETALKFAADNCPKTFIEYSSAVAELKRKK